MNVDFLTAIKEFFKKYVTFSGRSTRAEFWYAQLFIFLASLVFNILGELSGTFGAVGSTLGGLFSLAILLPTIAITTRRFHDTGRSGWWVVGFYVLSAILSFWAIKAISPYIDIKYLVGLETLDPAMLTNIDVLGMLKAMMPPVVLGTILYIVFLVLMCRPSGPDNIYGPDPYKGFGVSQSNDFFDNLD